MATGELDLLSLDPDRLLETHTVAEAEQVAARLSREAERAREELRVLVGERYRELLQAADTIQEMRGCAEDLITALGDLRGSCAGLGAGQAVTRPGGGAPDSSQVGELGVAASLKLLSLVPEQVWAWLDDNCRLAEGAELLLVAREAHTGLLAGGPELAARFPVISQQWEAVRQVQTSLAARARAGLAACQLEGEAGVDCLACLVLLEGGEGEAVVRQLLQARQLAVDQDIMSAWSPLSAPQSKKFTPPWPSLAWRPRAGVGVESRGGAGTAYSRLAPRSEAALGDRLVR